MSLPRYFYNYSGVACPSVPVLCRMSLNISHLPDEHKKAILFCALVSLQTDLLLHLNIMHLYSKNILIQNL